MADMGDYLESRFGVCMGHSIIMHLLWADDLVLISDTCAGLQKQLDGLQIFCSKNLTVVNEIKTKCMSFGKIETVSVTFNHKNIEQVVQYKFWGNVIKSVRRLNQNILAENQHYLSNQANRAVGAMYNRLRSVGTHPPHIMLHMFESLIKPITVYGSEIWGYNKTAQSETDKIFLRFARQILRVKPTTSNIIVFGECGIMPPSVQCIISTLCYLNRLYHLPGHLIVKQAYDELLRIHNNGFSTWIGNVCELVRTYNLDISLTVNEFKNECKRVVCESFKNDWYRSLIDLIQNPSLRTYVSFKFSFK